MTSHAPDYGDYDVTSSKAFQEELALKLQARKSANAVRMAAFDNVAATTLVPATGLGRGGLDASPAAVETPSGGPVPTTSLTKSKTKCRTGVGFTDPATAAGGATPCTPHSPASLYGAAPTVPVGGAATGNSECSVGSSEKLTTTKEKKKKGVGFAKG